MPFSGTSYSEISTGAADIETIISNMRVRLRNARAEGGAILSAMTAIGQEWGPIVSAADQLSASAPTNQAYSTLKSRVAALLSDFQAVQAEAQALDTELNG